MTGIASGALVTARVQSSSTTTSPLAPLAGSGTSGPRQTSPFTLGGDVGTCVTALLAAEAVDGSRTAATGIAFVHFTHDVLCGVVMDGLPLLRHLPVRAAAWPGETAGDDRLAAVAAMLGVFFVVPGVCLGITGLP